MGGKCILLPGEVCGFIPNILSDKLWIPQKSAEVIVAVRTAKD